MPSATPLRNLPWPLGTDRVMDGDDQIRKLAQSVENMIQVGRLTIPIVSANTVANVTWVFPVPFATATPYVFALPIGAIVSSNPSLSIQSIAANQAVINGLRATGNGQFDVFVLAVGSVTTVT